MKDATPRCAVAAVVLFACLPVAQGALAQVANTSDPTTWWPEPITGLMWAGTPHWNANGTPAQGYGLPWQEAVAYCANLKLGGFSNWRLPTMDEVKAATELRQISVWLESPAYSHSGLDIYKGLFFKGRTDFPSLGEDWFWTSTNENGGYWFAALNSDDGTFHRAPYISTPGVLCVRPMDAEMAALANDAHVDVPISTMEEFQAYVTVSKARSSYQATQYSASLQQAQAALQLKPNFLPALVGIGLSSGMLGQWDQAVSSLQAAKNLAKDDKAISNDLKWANSKAAKNLAKEYKAISDDLKWAKNGQKAAAKGKQPTGKTPVWN
jgi:tetratricopeptide (TPR) repeat protein